MWKQGILVKTNAVQKFKDKNKQDNRDSLNYYDGVRTAVKTDTPTYPSEKTELMKNSIKEEFSAFFMETSFTALTQIYKANSMWKRVVWTVLVIAMLVWMGIQCYWLLEKYYRYPVEVKMDMKVSTVLDFPSVTICNMNPILESNVYIDPYTPLIKYVNPDYDDSLYLETKNNWDYNQVCSSKDIRCGNGVCLPQISRCDGKKHCANGEDEDNCEDYECPGFMWKCKSTQKCIFATGRCDGNPGSCDENTSEDEDDCENYQCPDFMWKCKSSPKCINIYLRCDGIPGACNENTTEDEDDCGNQQCQKYQWKCKSGTCISEQFRCDGISGACGENTTEDEDDCENYQCPPSWWRCTTSPQCIFMEKRCDGVPGDCSPNTTEDEDGCENHQCLENYWKCTSPPKCILSYLRCNGIPGDCNANTTEDEEGCEDYQCPDEAWKCTSPPKCIDNNLRCNSSPGDCNANSTEDEDGCKNSICPSGFFRCSGGRCIPSRFRCDGYSSCENDELDCADNDLTKPGKHNGMPTTTPNGIIDLDEMFRNASFNKWKVLENRKQSFNYYDERDDEYEASMTYSFITAKLSQDVVEHVGHHKMDLIAACKFGGYQCSPMNFTYFHSHKYGNCYTFNSKFGNSSNLTTRFPGPENGLRLELFLDQDHYVANLAPDAGARILVHKKGSMPFPEDDGISIMPGRSTSIGIRQVSMSRLPPPYGSCDDTAKTTDYYRTYFGTDYSKLSCLKSCYQDMAIKHCRCAVPFYFVLDNATVCDMNNVDTEICVGSLPTIHFKDFEKCDLLCPIPCTETKYDLTISAATWPSEKYKSYLEKRLGQTNSIYKSKHDSDKEFTKLQIYFQDLIYEQVQQEKGYESMNLISDFGGQLGLWLGLSAITIGEICSFLFGVGRSLSLRWRRNETKSIRTDQTPTRYIERANIHEMYEEICPEPATYSLDVAASMPGSAQP